MADLGLELKKIADEKMKQLNAVLYAGSMRGESSRRDL